MSDEAIAVVKKFWELMGSNDFRSVGQVLGDDYVLEWPQSNERIRGRDKFAAVNEEYPAHGVWQFTINKIIGHGDEVVTDVSVTDGVQSARAISFFTVAGGKVVRMVEFWPDIFVAPRNRKHLTEPIA